MSIIPGLTIITSLGNVWHPSYTIPAAFDDSGSEQSRSTRHIIPAAEATLSGSKIRAWFEAGDTTYDADNVSIVPRNGSTDDGTTTPTELLFSGSSGFSLAAGGKLASDPLIFTFDHTVDHLLIIDTAGSTSEAAFKVHSGTRRYYRLTYNSYNLQTVSGFTSDNTLSLFYQLDVLA